LKLLEYQAKEVFRTYSIATPNEKVAETTIEAVKIANEIGFPLVVKAQVPVGGRGKAGGVKLCKNVEELALVAEQILSMSIKQCPVRKVLISQAVPFQNEYYLSITLDRALQKPVFIVSPSGGVDIEEIGRTNPELIYQVPVDLVLGLKDYEVRHIYKKCFSKEVLPPSFIDFYQLLEQLLSIYLKEDASLVEINPLIIVNGRFMALDAKMLIDDNAVFRHPAYAELQKQDDEETEQERIAREAGLAYISLDGNIACIVNGAGLAMATMDVVKYWGGEPANFLDIGGSSNPEKMVKALQIVSSNPKVKSVLINIFGGITRCDDIANGLVQAIDTTGFKLPLSVRLIGTNDETAKEILQKIKLNVHTDMNDAIKSAVKNITEAK
jgi:succinyl-CoA synthetase beta subunit